ncbi:hypothetical protein GA0074692_6761 [Micromonospora pallida]|uniref:Uncharacterized protein n=1 Tax=Micromonospora pallida TaxID=145854 RepID=A0A1C6TN70_9ACTN|nr:hypothetical protein [Micromonospora pallida]SCL43200.1 hypothetical protein GA0074692_6761 [Micromonospora pallida]
MTATVEIRSTEPVARARAERIRRGLQEWLETVQEIALAWERRDWEVLGYATWDDYVDQEIGAQLRLPEVHRRQAVTALRQVHMSTRAIGTALGISHSTVARDLASVSGETDAVLPETVRSLDGRERPATRPPAAPAAEAEATPAVNELDGLGEQYHQDPAARIAAVAEVAPEYVRRVDTPPTAGPADTDEVWIATARRGIQAHAPLAEEPFTRCRRSTRNGLILPAGQACERHAVTWCATCWTTPTVAPAVPAIEEHPAPVPASVPAVDVVDEPMPAPAPTSPGAGAGVPAPSVAKQTLTLAQIGRLRVVLRHIRQTGARPGPRQYELPFTPPPGVPDLSRADLVDVQWWDDDGYLAVRYLRSGSNGSRYEQHGVDLFVGSIDQAVDVLCALGILPAHLSSVYAAGVAAGMRGGDAIDGHLATPEDR